MKITQELQKYYKLHHLEGYNLGLPLIPPSETNRLDNKINLHLNKNLNSEKNLLKEGFII
jgi:hypothetical protein